jgi:ABC-2 type transport system permease protein
LSTNNTGFEIMGSIYLSMILVQVFIYTLSFLILNLLFKLPYGNLGLLILNISLMSMISISLGIMLVRIFKEPGVASLVINMVSLAMFFLYIGGVVAATSSKVPAVILTLAKFTPFYWAMESIEKSILLPNEFILLLIALTFFSAGNIKFSSFAKK